MATLSLILPLRKALTTEYPTLHSEMSTKWPCTPLIHGHVPFRQEAFHIPTKNTKTLSPINIATKFYEEYRGTKNLTFLENSFSEKCCMKWKSLKLWTVLFLYSCKSVAESTCQWVLKTWKEKASSASKDKSTEIWRSPNVKIQHPHHISLV